MNYDIFLCYRPQDALPHAWMLFRDLTAAGYSVWFPPELPNVQEDPMTVVEHCQAVLFLLSPDALCDASAPMLRVLSHAFSTGKSVTGIRLTGFSGLPDTLPAELEPLREIPVLSAEGTQYNHMVFRLLRGLSPSPQDVPVCPPPPDSEVRTQLQHFAAEPGAERSVTLRNRHQEQTVITFRKMGPDSVEELLEFQSSVVSGIPYGTERNIFESLSRDEYESDLRRGLCIGAYRRNRLVGLLVLLPHPSPAQNLLLDLPEFCSIHPEEIMVVDAVLVSEAVRGFGLQRTFNCLADCFSSVLGIRWECTVVSPLNFYSLSNTIRSGFRFVGNFPKYHSTRNFFVKEV